MNARNGDSIERVSVFERQCVESRIQELTVQLISEYSSEDMRRMAKEQRLAGNPVTMYPLDQAGIVEKFGEKARGEAMKILEVERKNFVDFKTPEIRNTIERNLKRLRHLVYDFDDEGKIFKVKIISEKMAAADNKGNWDEREVCYVGDHDFQRLEAINGILSQFSLFNEYARYMNNDLRKLWEDVSELGKLERVTK